jgi:hypothetical protein
MVFNINQLRNYFRSGLATVAINSPTASELTLTKQLLEVFSPSFNLYLWDIGKNLQKLELQQGKLTKNPVNNYSNNEHPVAVIFKHIETECNQINQGKSSLFILKDLMNLVTGESPNPALIRLAIDCFFTLKRSPHRLIILHDSCQIPNCFQDLVVELENPLPTESEISEMIEYRLEALEVSAGVAGVDFAVNLSTNDQQKLIRALSGMTGEAIDDTIQLIAISQGSIDQNSIKKIAAEKQTKLAAKGIQFSPTPEVEVQGLPILQEWATTITTLLEPEASQYNLPFPKGVLLVGLPGTGKSLAVKCLSQLWGIPSILLDLGSLMTHKLGGSEQNLRQALKAAESCSPCILFLDEIDKMFGNSTGETDGGTTQRLLGYFLNWFVENKAHVFVAATANRPWHFPPEMLRRFTKTFLVDLPNETARQQIWQVQLAHYQINLTQENMALLATESPNFTGDEIRKIVEHCATIAYANRCPTQVNLADLLGQVHQFKPQFNEENQEVQALRQWANNGGATLAELPQHSHQLSSLERDVLWHS